jgi:hypothetical protein
MTWERVTARELEVGDQIASTRTQEPATVAMLEAPGASSRYIVLGDGSRIRPQYTTKFWRVTS